jgi:hypothetical protein
LLVGSVTQKIAWADAERPKHLVLFVSYYVTNNARILLDKIARDKVYKVRLIAEKQLERLVLRSRT